jgi:hypothetical protein
MTEQTRNYVIAGGIGLGAIAMLAVISRSGKSVAPVTPAAPAPATPPTLGVSPYPAASFQAAPITIISAPTFNAPGFRPDFFPGPVPDKTDECTCRGECKAVDYPPLTLSVFTETSRKLAQIAGSRSMAPATNNQTAQFPPSLYPYLYR